MIKLSLLTFMNLYLLTPDSSQYFLGWITREGLIVNFLAHKEELIGEGVLN